MVSFGRFTNNPFLACIVLILKPNLQHLEPNHLRLSNSDPNKILKLISHTIKESVLYAKITEELMLLDPNLAIAENDVHIIPGNRRLLIRFEMISLPSINTKEYAPALALRAFGNSRFGKGPHDIIILQSNNDEQVALIFRELVMQQEVGFLE